MSRWRARLQDPAPPRIKVLKAPFAGIPAGATMLVPTPALIDAELRTVLPGSFVAVASFRQRLATAQDCDATCPVTTGIHLRVVAEVAMEDLAAGVPVSDVAPVWRVLDADAKAGLRLPDGGALMQQLRSREAATVGPTRSVQAEAKPR